MKSLKTEKVGARWETVVREGFSWAVALSRVTRKYKGARHRKRGDVVLENRTACAKALWQEICNERS